MKDLKYKHELIIVDDLRINKDRNIPVAMLEDTIRPYRNKNNEVVYNEVQFPEMFLITRVIAANGMGEDRSVYLYYYDLEKGMELYKQVHHMVQFAKLLGTKAKDVLMEAMDIQYKNLEKNLQHAFTIGSDPEIFLEDEKGTVIPAYEFLKAKGDSTRDVHQYGSDVRGIYWDGYQAEFETHAFTCLEQHSASVQTGLTKLLAVAKEYNKKARLSTKTVMTIPEKMLQEAKTEHVSLGCMPSSNIYGMSGEHVEDPRMLPFRPAGGHIHFGIGKSDHERVKPMVKALDAILGVACVSLFQKYDDPVRRQYYGLAGEYRLPPHGMEYRTLSNAWLYHPIIMNFVFDFARKVLVFGEKGFLVHWKATEEETIRCINTCDVNLAHEIMERNKDTIIKLFKAAYGQWMKDKPVGQDEKVFEALYNIFYKGMDCVVKDTKAFESNWNMASSSLYSGAEPRNFNRNIEYIISAGKKAS
jgi:hypothetical protein